MEISCWLHLQDSQILTERNGSLPIKTAQRTGLPISTLHGECTFQKVVQRL